MIIAIDGPAGTGKGTIAKLISKRLGFIYIDTGAMYRCVTLDMLRKNVMLSDIDKIKEILEKIDIKFKNVNDNQLVFLNGEDVTKLIRMPDVNENVSNVSKIKEIRDKLVEMQRKLGENENTVMEGGDITTVVFPNADLKIYLDADVKVRAERRYKELINNGNIITYDEVLDSIIRRDKNDMEKEYGALTIAKDAVVIDTTNLTPDDVFLKIENLINKN